MTTKTLSQSLLESVRNVLATQANGWLLEAAGDMPVEVDGYDIVVRDDDGHILAKVRLVASQP